jgi:8-oxo-dGTP diphosphatase
VAEELGAELAGLDGGPVLHRIGAQAGLDLSVWVSRRWRGTVTNLQPEEHDAIGWFEKEQLDGLCFADPSYLTVVRHLLSVSWKCPGQGNGPDAETRFRVSRRLRPQAPT